MMSMTHTSFDTESHPRSASSGRFTEAQHSAPEAGLVADHRPLGVRADIEAVTHGRDELDRAIGTGRFGFIELSDARMRVWEGAGGPRVSQFKLEPHLNAVNLDITTDNVERVLEVASYRAKSGRYEVADSGDLALVPVDAQELRNADWQAAGRSDHAGEMMNAGQQVGPEVEISDSAARLFAEEALQNLPQRLPIIFLPRLAEFANTPYTEAGGADPAKVDALHDELARIRAAHDYLAPHQHKRLDMLATFATHALPGQD